MQEKYKGMRTEYSIAVHQEDGATGTKEILPTNSLIGDMVYLIP